MPEIKSVVNKYNSKYFHDLFYGMKHTGSNPLVMF